MSACLRPRPPIELPRGYALVAWMIAMALLSAAAMTTVSRWSDDIRREREDELLRIGNEIAGAIAAYAQDSAGSAIRHPPSLEDLLEDRRAFGMRRHLRRVEPDPMRHLSAASGWGLLRGADGGIEGVYSTSNDRPVRVVAQHLQHVDLPAASRYADWVFRPRSQAPKSSP